MISALQLLERFVRKNPLLDTYLKDHDQVIGLPVADNFSFIQSLSTYVDAAYGGFNESMLIHWWGRLKWLSPAETQR